MKANLLDFPVFWTKCNLSPHPHYITGKLLIVWVVLPLFPGWWRRVALRWGQSVGHPAPPSSSDPPVNGYTPSSTRSGRTCFPSPVCSLTQRWLYWSNRMTLAAIVFHGIPHSAHASPLNTNTCQHCNCCLCCPANLSLLAPVPPYETWLIKPIIKQSVTGIFYCPFLPYHIQHSLITSLQSWPVESCLNHSVFLLSCRYFFRGSRAP